MRIIDSGYVLPAAVLRLDFLRFYILLHLGLGGEHVGEKGKEVKEALCISEVGFNRRKFPVAGFWLGFGLSVWGQLIPRSSDNWSGLRSPYG